jgi:hypothetical protein
MPVTKDRHTNLKAANFNYRWLGALVRGELRGSIEGLPKDAEAVDAFVDPWTRDVIVVFQSKEFPELPEGTQTPLLKLELVTRE